MFSRIFACNYLSILFFLFLGLIECLSFSFSHKLRNKQQSFIWLNNSHIHSVCVRQLIKPRLVANLIKVLQASELETQMKNIIERPMAILW